MKITIKNRFDGSEIYSNECEENTILKTVLSAIENNADLSGADLSGAVDENGKRINMFLNIKGSAHSVFWRGNGMIKIGCIEKSISEWKKQFKAVGQAYDYSESRIEEYGKYISMI